MEVQQNTEREPINDAQAAKEPAPDTKAVSGERDIQENKDIAALSYVWILSVVVYFAKKNSPFVRFHARQGIVIFLLSIAVWMMPLIGRFLELLLLCVAVLGFLGAAQGEKKELPIIGPLVRRDKKALRENWRMIVQGAATGLSTLRERLFHSEKKVQNPPTNPPPPPPQA